MGTHHIDNLMTQKAENLLPINKTNGVFKTMSLCFAK